MGKNDAGKYFKYAIGEIILVVVGILIALQINNWNEERKNNNQELKIIAGLYSEVIQNLELTIDFKKESEDRLIAVKNLLNMSPETLELMSDEKLNQFIMNSAITQNYSPLVSKLNRILSMDNFESTKENNLISLLYAYSKSIHDINIQSDSELETFMNKQIPLFNKNISVKNIMHLMAPEEISKSENVVNIKSFIKSLEFENIYADLFATSKLMIRYLDKNIEIMRQLIELINETYPTIINAGE